MRLIGINGFKTSGKDTTYAIIRRIEPDARRVAFADKLKLLAALSLGLEFSDSILIDLMNACKESWTLHLASNDVPDDLFHSITGREFLQHLGNHARRVFGDTFWIDQVLPPDHDALMAMYPYENLLVVTDVRYANEAERVKAIGGSMWEIVRPGIDSDGHASEIPLPRELVDLTIINDGSLADLEAKVKEAFNE